MLGKRLVGKGEQQPSQDKHHGGICSWFSEIWWDSTAEMRPDIPSGLSVGAEPKLGYYYRSRWSFVHPTLCNCIIRSDDEISNGHTRGDLKPPIYSPFIN